MKLSVLLLGAVLLITTGDFARAQTTAQISGSITDASGASVPKAQVTVVGKDTGLKRTTESNDTGYYVVPLLQPGQYVVTVQAQGFQTMLRDNIILNVEQEAGLDFTLQVGVIGQTITVEGGAPLVNTTDGSVGTVVDRQFVTNMPLNGRSFQSLLTLTPGVVTVPAGTNTGGQFSVNGQRPSANGFTVDGTSANVGASPSVFGGPQTSGNLPGLTTLGTTQSLVSVDALQEFKVQTSSYAAEYGRQPGGQISIVTRSGSNVFHGSLFEYLRNDVLDANDWFANQAGQPKPRERQNDFGGVLGGPIIKNRTFFFFSYEGLRLRQPTFALTNVPSLTLRQQAPSGVQPLLSSFPLPNGRDLGNGLAEFSTGYSVPSSLDSTSVRIDHTINTKLTLFGRYQVTPSETDTRSALNLSSISISTLRNQSITGGATASLTPRLSTEARVNYTSNDARFAFKLDNFGGATPSSRNALIPSQFDSPTAEGAVSLLFPGRTAQLPGVSLQDRGVTSQSQFNIVGNVSSAVRSHRLKFGADYRRLTPSAVFATYFLSLLFQSQQQVMAGTAPSGSVSVFAPVEPVFVNFSAYGQDEWRVSGRLTLDLGLRWEVNPAPSEANGLKALAVTRIADLSTAQLAPKSKAWKTTYNNIAPRFGIAYQLCQTPGRLTVVRGGVGVFYDTGNDNGANPFTKFPYNSNKTVTNVSYPLSQPQLAPLPVPVPLAPPYRTVFAFDPDLKLPYTLQWNLAVEQSLGRDQVATVSYVGAAGRSLLQSTQFDLSAINPAFTTFNLVRNRATSDYEALQAQFQRRLSRGLQALASYTWSHALDEDSSSVTGSVAQRGTAAFDIRHAFASALTYDIPSPRHRPIVRAVLGGWSADTSVHAQSALPVDIIAATINNPADGSLINVRPNVISGVPFYLDGTQFPGGRSLNNTIPTAQQIADAGCRPLSSSTPAKGAFCTPQAGQSGNFGRNQVRGLGAWQTDAAMRREFRLTERLKLQFRAEAFNLLNHPNFGTIQTTLSAANFGQATNMLGRQLGGLSPLYQVGGPRSMQFALKLAF